MIFPTILAFISSLTLNQSQGVSSYTLNHDNGTYYSVCAEIRDIQTLEEEKVIFSSDYTDGNVTYHTSFRFDCDPTYHHLNFFINGEMTNIFFYYTFFDVYDDVYYYSPINYEMLKYDEVEDIHNPTNITFSNDHNYYLQIDFYCFDPTMYSEFFSHGDYQDGYYNGYNDGYDVGFDDGLQVGYEDAITEVGDTSYNNGYNVGFTDGYNNALSTHSFSFTNLFASIGDTPILMIRRLFGFELFGVSLLSAFMSLFTALIVIRLVKKFLK